MQKTMSAAAVQAAEERLNAPRVYLIQISAHLAFSSTKHVQFA